MARRTAHKLFQTAVALVLAMAVFGGAVQAGRIYWYCTGMQATSSHACCAKRGASAELDVHVARAAAVVAPECCQSRSHASLEACTPNTSSSLSSLSQRAEHELPLQPALAPPLGAELALYRVSLAAQDAADAAQIGRARLRVHARLMVFLI